MPVQDHIDRYCHLIVFCCYLSTSGHSGDGERQPFAAFLASYPEIRSVMDRLLWAFPLLTLELDNESGRDKLSDSEKALEVCCVLRPLDFPAAALAMCHTQHLQVTSQCLQPRQAV